jgi:glucose/arabinose dehydrogenase
MNHYVQGGFYGHPFIVGNKIPRYEFLDRDDIIDLAEETIVPEWTSGAHWAANSMTFYTGDQFPSEIMGDAFVSYHGSWNRSVKSGYQVTRVLFEFGHPYGEQPFVKFIDEKSDVLGRPVDTLVEPDGSLLISEDHGYDGTFRIYRLKYAGDK